MACQDDLPALNRQGMLVAVPNPSPADTVAIEEAIHTALADAERDGIEGAAVTPYILARVEKLTKGKSLDANVALVKNNARVAANIAIQYCPLAPKRNSPEADVEVHVTSGLPPAASMTPTLTTSGEPAGTTVSKSPPSSGSASMDIIDNKEVVGKPSVLVIGGAVVDQVMTPSPHTSSGLVMHTSNPGSISTNYGGVGRNIAEAMARLGECNVSLLSAVGNDAQGAGLLRHASEAGVDVSHVVRGAGDQHTAVYAAVHDHTGDLVVAIADMDIFGKVLSPEIIKCIEWKIARSQIVVSDGNISPQSFGVVADCCEVNRVPLFFEPTSVHKCTVPLIAKSLGKVSTAEDITSVSSF